MLVLRSVLTSTLLLTDPEDFVVPVRVDVRAVCGDTGRAYTVGRLGMDRIRWAEALEAGESTFAVCDTDSQGLCDLHHVLTGGGEDLRDDFGLDGPTAEVLFVHRFVLHPDLAEYRAVVLGAAADLHDRLSLTAVWADAGGLTPAELTGLGFRKVAGEPVFARHWTFPRPDDGPALGEVADDFRPTAGHQRWLRAAWNRDDEG